MTPQPGCRFAVAPHFHLPTDWSRRLLVGAGVEEVDGAFFAPGSWRPPTPEELDVLVQTAAEPMSPEELDACVCLFQLPRHLQSRWWLLLEQAAGVLEDGRLPGFNAFVSQLLDFLDFKDLPVPAGAHCDAVVSQPGQPFVHRGPGGLLCTLAPSAAWPGEQELGGQRLWGGINLGDEPTSAVLLNLPWQKLAAELRRRPPDQPSPVLGERVGQFFRSCPDYPMVRLTLGPGEGYRLPLGGLILVDHLADKQGPSVLLLISQGGARSS
jgi:hypothetical protein